MTEQIQELIDKIKSEGIEAAEQQAQDIEAQAKQQADEIIKKAKDEAHNLIENAQAECQRKRESSRQALKHAARDTMLSLRKEIEHLLMGIVSHEVSDALTPEKMVQILSETIQGYLAEHKETQAVEVRLNAEDRQAITDGFMKKLQKDIKQTITLKAADDIKAGFTISFDEGKSCFDFTENSLVEYLSNYLNPALTEIIKEK